MASTLRTKRASYAIAGSTLLHDVTLSLMPRMVHVVIGPNGAGKSTLLRLLAGDITPTSGEVYLGEKLLQHYSKEELALRRAVMPQDVALSLPFTGEEVVMMGRYPHPDHIDHRPIVDEMMQATESEPLRDRLYPTMSGGEQARVTLARVLAQETPVIFLDEPTASLDPRHQHLAMKLARRHATQGGTVFAILHDLNLAAAYADDIILLNQGRLRAQGPPDVVLRPNLLREVFQTDFYVDEHPGLPHLLALSLPTTD